jgi:WD40 repeat protein
MFCVCIYWNTGNDSSQVIWFFSLAVAVFNGHQNSTFYVKSSLSPDDQFLISGSSDEAAYIWKVSCYIPTQIESCGLV